MEPKDNVTTVNRCVGCNKLMKRADVNESGMCPKCLAAKAAEQSANLLNFGDGNGEQIGSEQPNAGENVGDNNAEQNQPVNGSEQQPLIEGEGTGDNAAAQPENKPEDKSTPNPEPAVVKPGQAIRDRFCELVEQGKINDEVLKVLTDKEATSKATSIRYAFLKEYNPDVDLKTITYVNGAARYSSKPIVVNGKEYVMTNDLYKTTVPKFIAWADSLGK